MRTPALTGDVFQLPPSPTPQTSQFCHDDDDVEVPHSAFLLTRQNDLCRGRSAWEVVRANRDFWMAEPAGDGGEPPQTEFKVAAVCQIKIGLFSFFFFFFNKGLLSSKKIAPISPRIFVSKAKNSQQSGRHLATLSFFFYLCAKRGTLRVVVLLLVKVSYPDGWIPLPDQYHCGTVGV